LLYAASPPTFRNGRERWGTHFVAAAKRLRQKVKGFKRAGVPAPPNRLLRQHLGQRPLLYAASPPTFRNGRERWGTHFVAVQKRLRQRVKGLAGTGARSTLARPWSGGCVNAYGLRCMRPWFEPFTKNAKDGAPFVVSVSALQSQNLHHLGQDPRRVGGPPCSE